MRTDRLPPLGLAALTVLEVPPLDLVPLAARAGFAAIGLRLAPAAPGGVAYRLSRADQAELRHRLDGEGLRVHDVEILTLDPAFQPAAHAPLLDLAAVLGARRVTVCGEDPEPARLAASLAGLAELAAARGLGIDLEFMGWRATATLAQAEAAVRAADHPGAAVLIDALHLARTGATPADVAMLPAALLVSAQLCDAPPAAPPTRDALIAEARGERKLPGSGALPLAALLAALPETTVLSAEIPLAAVADPAERARRAFAATAGLFAADSTRSPPAPPAAPAGTATTTPR